ncbi:hypothetical protein AB0H00_31095 [Nocardia sp. NPDC023852]|uniref:hypothetical protein n=1 Tax=Nocardia sp. NPDC023852 TaxID=3154697 RepID=UPI0033FA437A
MAAVALTSLIVAAPAAAAQDDIDFGAAPSSSSTENTDLAQRPHHPQKSYQQQLQECRDENEKDPAAQKCCERAVKERYGQK